MLCGGAEIDLDDGVDGLLILPDDAPIGVNLREYLNLDNHILDISITPNRGDCFSVRGIARELCVINDLPFKLPFDIPTINASCDDKTAVLVQTASCPRYYARTIINLNGTQKSPKFIQDALLGSGIAPKNLIVDITNFVLMELGQPLHAFDKDKLVGDISVRLAKQGETLVLLNGQSISLTGDELVICDEAGVIALAGIMGGQRTMVDDTTTSIVLESAFLTPWQSQVRLAVLDYTQMLANALSVAWIMSYQALLWRVPHHFLCLMAVEKLDIPHTTTIQAICLCVSQSPCPLTALHRFWACKLTNQPAFIFYKNWLLKFKIMGRRLFAHRHHTALIYPLKKIW